MSLINQVLLDLDRRQAPASAMPLARAVPALPRTNRAGRWALAVFVAVAGAGVFVVSTRATPLAPEPSPAPAAQQYATIAPWSEPAPAAMTMSSPAEIAIEAVALVPAKRSDARQRPIDEPQQLALAAPTIPPRPALAPSTAARLAITPEASVEKRDRPLSPHERADAEYQRGLALHQQGQAEQARSAFASALREDRRHAPARHALAVALLGEGKAEAAEATLAEGLGTSSQDALLAATLARIKADRHDLAGAIAVLKGALPANGGTKADAPEARALLATLQQRNANHADAIENYAAALRTAPANGPWWIGLGVSLAASGRADNAREAFERARATELTPELARYVEQRLAPAAR